MLAYPKDLTSRCMLSGPAPYILSSDRRNGWALAGVNHYSVHQGWVALTACIQPGRSPNVIQRGTLK